MNATHHLSVGQQITLHLGRRVLKSGKMTKGTARVVTVTEVTDDSVTGTFKCNGLNMTGEWTMQELADRLG